MGWVIGHAAFFSALLFWGEDVYGSTDRWWVEWAAGAPWISLGVGRGKGLWSAPRVTVSRWPKACPSHTAKRAGRSRVAGRERRGQE